MDIVFVWGPPCSGKTTMVKDLMRDGDILYDYDALLAALTGKAEHAQPISQSGGSVAAQIARGMRLRIIQQLPSGGSGTVYIISMMPTPAAVDEARAMQIPYRIIKATATEAECLQRLAADPTRADKRGTAAAIRSWFDWEKAAADE